MANADPMFYIEITQEFMKFLNLKRFIIYTQDIGWTECDLLMLNHLLKSVSLESVKKIKIGKYVPNHFLEDPKMALLKLQS